MNGIVFHIEEDAYEVLKRYMTEIKRHFAYSADSDEIITDIENRLAEMFNERLADQNKQVIVLQDVEEITSVMGSVNDFDYAAEDSSAHSSTIEKRFLRDPDDKTIAGVCSGLGHYLGIEAKWVRLIFLVVGITTGTTLILYAILWIVIPEASTRQEKMAMKGEPINLQNFKKTFEMETDHLNLSLKNPSIKKAGDTIEDVLTSIFNFIFKVLKVFVKGIGLVIVIVGLIALVFLLGAFVFGIGFLRDSQFNNFLVNTVNPEYRSTLIFSAFILIIIPIIALISFAIRVIFNYRIISRTGAFAMLILWLTGLGMGIYNGSKVASEFREDAGFEQQTDLNNHTTFFIKSNRSRLLSKDDSINLNLDNNFKGNILSSDDDEFESLRVNLSIEKSETGKAVILKDFKARGKNFEEALKNAQGIRYRLFQQDSILMFDKRAELSKNVPFRKQEVNVTLKVPVGTHIEIDHDFTWNINIRNYNVWDCRNDDTPDNAPFKLIMTEEGIKCAENINKDENDQSN